MKKFLYILTLLCLINTPIFAYGIYNSPGSCNSYRSTSLYLAPSRTSGITQTAPSTQYRIGYTTQQTYRGTYTPAASSSGGRPGQPRRIVVYNGDGDSLNTPGPEDNPDWIYRFDGSRWWYSSDGGYTWNFWSDGFKFIFDIIKPGWYSSDGTWWGPGDPGSNAEEYYGYNPTPIGDLSITPLLLATSLYIFIKRRKRIKLAANFLLYEG